MTGLLEGLSRFTNNLSEFRIDSDCQGVCLGNFLVYIGVIVSLPFLVVGQGRKKSADKAAWLRPKNGKTLRRKTELAQYCYRE